MKKKKNKYPAYMNMKPRDAFEEALDKTNQTSGEVCLWRSVIEQAFADATYKGSIPECKMARDKAREWLSKPSKHLQDVCDMAEMDMRFILIRARELFHKHGIVRNLPQARQMYSPLTGRPL